MARGRFVLRALVDLAGIAGPITGAPPKKRRGDKDHKRILVFNWRDQRHDFAGGAEVYIHELSKRLVRDGNTVTMFCGSDGKGAPRHETIDGVNIVRRGGFYFVYVWAFFYYIFRFRGRFDLIIDCHNGIPFFTPLYAREPVICIVHHVHQEVFKTQMSKWPAKLACWLEAKLMPKAYEDSQYVAVSPSTKREMRELGIRGDIQLIYNGVDLDNLQPGEKSKQPLVIFLGRVQKYKSVDTLISAFRLVHKQLPRAELVIAGSGDADDGLKAMVKKHRMTSYVTFTGKVTPAEKISWFQKAWLMVNPSLMEGWGITTIEANACATPVIGSDVPGLRDSIKHDQTGKLVEYGNVQAFSKEIVSLLTNHDERRKLEGQAHVWAQQFHWDVSAKKLAKLVEARL